MEMAYFEIGFINAETYNLKAEHHKPFLDSGQGLDRGCCVCEMYDTQHQILGCL